MKQVTETAIFSASAFRLFMGVKKIADDDLLPEVQRPKTSKVDSEGGKLRIISEAEREDVRFAILNELEDLQKASPEGTTIGLHQVKMTSAMLATLNSKRKAAGVPELTTQQLAKVVLPLYPYL